MHFDTRLWLSPSDLSGFLGCRHRTGLDLAVARGALERPEWIDPFGTLLRDRGEAHERAFVESLRTPGRRVAAIERDAPLAVRGEATLQAMREGADVIVQAALAHDHWLGYADVLQRVDVPSALGVWSYEPYDTKLARETRGGTILQLAMYADLLGHLQGVTPAAFHVVTPGTAATTVDTHQSATSWQELKMGTVPIFTVTTYRLADFAAYFRGVRRQFEDTLALGHDDIRTRHEADPVEHCDLCRWQRRCRAEWRRDDHLSFIAGISRLHRAELIAQGYPTLAAAAAMPLPVPFQPARGSRDAYVRVREQARLQHLQRTANRPVHELLPVVENQGLARLPEPSATDLFLDLEAARFAREGGREYLFGLWTRTPGHAAADRDAQYGATWAFTDDEERAAFESLIDRVTAAWAADPGMHVYHFGHYEPSALKRLMGRHATRADELDRLLRAERFVDLHAVVRQALRAGVESYSIKQLEQFYAFARDVALDDAGAQLQAIELALERGAAAALADGVREAVRGYNRDDCRSTEALRDWLERLRTEVVAGGAAVPRPAPKAGEPHTRVVEMERRQEEARSRLLASLPPAAIAADHPQHPLYLLAYLIDWHRREDKSHYWERYRLAEQSDEDLMDEPQALAGLRHVTRLDQQRYKNGNLKTVVDRYSYPHQEVELGRSGELRMRGNDVVGSIADHDRLARTIDIRKGRDTHDLHPASVFQAMVFSTDVHQEALLRFAADPGGTSCGADLLFRRPPRLRATLGSFAAVSGSPTHGVGGTPAEIAVRLAGGLDRTTLAIQGPPGSGKTYVGAQMIRTLVRAGKKVGVTAVSHKVIRNLLDAVVAQEARDAGPATAIRLGHKVGQDDDEGDEDPHAAVVEIDDNDEALGALASGAVHVLGATTWLWSREGAAATVDVLFVDEAGQMSLANALAISGAADSLVLLGDPQQLEQPQKGAHPDGVGASALEHVLGGAPTMPPDRGLFLPTTWRLHPAICRFTSELFYEAKLESKPGLERQRLSGTASLDGSGLWFVPVAHDGNQNYSLEEVDAVAGLVDVLLAPGSRWIDEHGTARVLTGGDLLVVAAFNAQVNRLSERLVGRGVRVGTVDRFQGQEAPVVIYSMATSRPEDAPRGMEFLYSLNRLNVATSRARCAAIVVASPRLLEPACRTPRQMVLANALCRYREMARVAVI